MPITHVMATPSQAWSNAARAGIPASGLLETNMANQEVPRTGETPVTQSERVCVGRRYRPGRRRSQRGAEMVEFALLIPLIFMLITGMFTGGIAYNTQLDLTHAAREGARYGATFAKATSTTTGWATNVQNIVVQRSGGAIVANQVCVSLVTGSTPTVLSDPNTGDTTNQYTTNPDGSSPCIAADNSTDTGDRVQVIIGVSPAQHKTTQLQAVIFSYTINLTATALSKYED